MTWNKRVRQFHRGLSIAFTVLVLVNIVLNFMGPESVAIWVGIFTLLPLVLLMFTGLYLFVLPYRTRRRAGEAPRDSDDRSVEGDDRIRKTVVVQMRQEAAFELFTIGMASWWPREYTWAGEVLEAIGIEPREGGHCFERGPYGFECDWGRVLAWKPPHRLVFSWQISPERAPVPDPATASEVEVRFVAEEPSVTRIELEHRDFARHGERGGRYRAAMASEMGWPMILGRFTAAVG